MAGLFCVRATISCRALSAHTTAPRQGWRDGSGLPPSTEPTALMAFRTAGLLPIWRWGSTNTSHGHRSAAGHSPPPHQVAGITSTEGWQRGNGRVVRFDSGRVHHVKGGAIVTISSNIIRVATTEECPACGDLLLTWTGEAYTAEPLWAAGSDGDE